MTDVQPRRGQLSRSPRRATVTSPFGVSRRESHDASPFYARFAMPAISTDDTVLAPAELDRIWVGDARDMDAAGNVNDNSVALVVTSPPYFSGKEYEETLGARDVPASYRDYLDMLHAVFAECWRKLEAGGRIGVNVANLGRKPYRSLSADVIRILEDLGYLLRGEVIWRKQQAAGGSCAWGSYQRPANPVLRDTTERVVVASKGRFDRALTPVERQRRGLPCEGSIHMDEFVDATTDVWEIPAERASRVGHPAPFPVELPRRLIDLFTYRGDLVLDPFMGAGATAVAAIGTERHYIGFDTDGGYVERAEQRIAEARAASATAVERRVVVAPRARRDEAGESDDFAAAVRAGEKATEVAVLTLEQCGFTSVERGVVVRDIGVDVALRALDASGRPWLFDLVGAFSTTRPGLRRGDAVWRCLGKAAVVSEARRAGRERSDLGPFVLLTTDAPARNSAAGRALAAAHDLVRDVVELFDADGLARLRGYASAVNVS